MKSILDPSFRYIDAASTDIRKTFARIRRERDKVKSVVVPINKQRKGAKA